MGEKARSLRQSLVASLPLDSGREHTRTPGRRIALALVAASMIVGGLWTWNLYTPYTGRVEPHPARWLGPVMVAGGYMLKRFLMVILLLGLLTCTANAQETVNVVGGSATLVIKPDTVTVEIPIAVPPDTIFVTDTVLVEVCPEGWECIPPPEPEPTVRFEVSVVNGKIIGELTGDSAAIAETRMVGFYVNGTLIRNESVPAFCLGGGDASPCTPYTPTVTGELTLLAKRYLRPDGTEDYTEVVTVNPNVPPEPPDSTPPTPPDTTPTPPDSVGPTPGDTIIGQIPLGTPQNIRIAGGTITFDPIPEDTVTTCVSCGTWWERQAVVNDDSVIGDEIYYSVGAWGGPLPYDPEAEWQVGYEDELATTSWMIPQSMYPLPDTVTVCVGAVAWDARSYEGPGGAKRYCGETSVGYRCSYLYPISETSCQTLSP